MAEKFRVFATTDIGREALDGLRDRGWEVEVYDHLEAPPKELILEKVRSGVDALITTLRDRIDEEIFAAGSRTRLKVVAQDSVGFDNIDRKAANRHKIPFTNTPDVLTDATAEFSFFMLGAVARKLYSAELQVRQNEWTTWHPYRPWLGDEVSGRTLAVIGMGRIGKSVINKAVGFDMDILCHDPTYEEHSFIEAIRWFMEVRHRERLCPRMQKIEYVGLEDALKRADYVSLHVPLTLPGSVDEPTLHLINEERLRMMKPSAYIVNTSRGAVIDEKALALALQQNWIAGAALDVYKTEPLPEDSPLRDERLVDKLRLYPHAASAARDTRLSPDPNVGMAGRCVQGVVDVLCGHHGGDPREMPYVVNKEAF